ncbi:MAG: asparagine synthase-related protein [Parasphingorhabdus sp.]|uniref:asparagine synthase-related protein n=1 Tax=Parasphingorhabdus sp. TaxID=2709688 RepID=UPI00300184E3
MSCYNDEHIFIGHCLFDTGCNGFAIDEDGYAISFDGRLDNRNQLCAKLRAGGAMTSPMTDSVSDTRLLLLAYLHFGTDLPKYLLGDFAIAIWDVNKQHLFLCRDHFGVRPLFYRIEGDDFLFASEIKALRAMRPELPYIPHLTGINAFVAGNCDEDEPERSFIADVYRLLPGHSAIIEEGKIKTQRYWRLDPNLPKPIKDVHQQFRELFIQAINRRTRGTPPIAALLSGGLDSSSIVSSIGAGEIAISPTDIDVFSLTFKDDDTPDETEYIAAVKDSYSFSHRTVDGSHVSGLGTADVMITEQDQPPIGPNGAVFRHLLQTVADQTEAKILLHGHGGDEIVSEGAGLFEELAGSGRWLRLWRELGAIKQITGKPGPHFRRLIWRKGTRKALVKLMRWPKHAFGKKADPVPRDPIKFEPGGQLRPAEQIAHLKKLTSPMFGQALEITDHDAAHAGIEIRMPFLDVELAEFCVRVKADEKWKDGLPRSVVRGAMKDILPEKIRLRTDKHDFADHLKMTMLRDDREIVDDAILRRSSLISPYTDLVSLKEDWDDLKITGELDGWRLMRLWRAVILSRWLSGVNVPTERHPAPDVLLAAAE